jgi:hypothetical protein
MRPSLRAIVRRGAAMNEDLFANNDEERGKAESKKLKAERRNATAVVQCIFSSLLSLAAPERRSQCPSFCKER